MTDLTEAKSERVDLTLVDQRVFQLDEAQWAAFMAELDLPPRDNPRLRRLMAIRAPWDPE